MSKEKKKKKSSLIPKEYEEYTPLEDSSIQVFDIDEFPDYHKVLKKEATQKERMERRLERKKKREERKKEKLLVKKKKRDVKSRRDDFERKFFRKNFEMIGKKESVMAEKGYISEMKNYMQKKGKKPKSSKEFLEKEYFDFSFLEVNENTRYIVPAKHSVHIFRENKISNTEAIEVPIDKQCKEKEEFKNFLYLHFPITLLKRTIVKEDLILVVEETKYNHVEFGFQKVICVSAVNVNGKVIIEKFEAIREKDVLKTKDKYNLYSVSLDLKCFPNPMVFLLTTKEIILIEISYEKVGPPEDKNVAYIPPRLKYFMMKHKFKLYARIPLQRQLKKINHLSHFSFTSDLRKVTGRKFCFFIHENMKPKKIKWGYYNASKTTEFGEDDEEEEEEGEREGEISEDMKVNQTKSIVGEIKQEKPVKKKKKKQEKKKELKPVIDNGICFLERDILLEGNFIGRDAGKVVDNIIFNGEQSILIPTTNGVWELDIKKKTFKSFIKARQVTNFLRFRRYYFVCDIYSIKMFDKRLLNMPCVNIKIISEICILRVEEIGEYMILATLDGSSQVMLYLLRNEKLLSFPLMLNSLKDKTSVEERNDLKVIDIHISHHGDRKESFRMYFITANYRVFHENYLISKNIKKIERGIVKKKKYMEPVESQKSIERKINIESVVEYDDIVIPKSIQLLKKKFDEKIEEQFWTFKSEKFNKSFDDLLSQSEDEEDNDDEEEEGEIIIKKEPIEDDEDMDRKNKVKEEDYDADSDNSDMEDDDPKDSDYKDE